MIDVVRVWLSVLAIVILVAMLAVFGLWGRKDEDGEL